MHTFDTHLPEPASQQVVEVCNKEFTVASVVEWAERHGNIQGRFRFFETFHANSEFYQRIARPLLSMCTVGSIDVERRIKLIKHNILTKKCKCMSNPKSVAIFRASENLRHIMKAKKQLAKKSPTSFGDCLLLLSCPCVDVFGS